MGLLGSGQGLGPTLASADHSGIEAGRGPAAALLGLLNLLVHRCHLSGHICSDRLGIGLGSLR